MQSTTIYTQKKEEIVCTIYHKSIISRHFIYLCSPKPFSPAPSSYPRDESPQHRCRHVRHQRPRHQEANRSGRLAYRKHTVHETVPAAKGDNGAHQIDRHRWLRIGQQVHEGDRDDQQIVLQVIAMGAGVGVGMAKVLCISGTADIVTNL